MVCIHLANTYRPLTMCLALLQVLRIPWWIRQSPWSFKEFTVLPGWQAMKFLGSDKCNKDIKILPIFTKCLYFPPYSTQILCTIMFIVLPIYSIHLRFSPVFILAWQNPNLIKPKPLPSSHLLLGSWICLEKNNNPNWSHFDFMVTIPIGSSLQLPGNHITFPNHPSPILLPN